MFSANSSQVSEDRLYVEDVFSTWLYTGNGTGQTITNGIDLSGKGGLVWFKRRDDTISNCLVDTVRGSNKLLFSNTTQANVTDSNVLTSFGSTGFTVGIYNESNASGGSYASWTFRKAPKFFDVVTYTGDGTGDRTISHSLTTSPGMVIIRPTNLSTNWRVWHRYDSTKGLRLNLTDAQSTNDFLPSVSSTGITVDTTFNGSGNTYVAYLFAHDTTSDGIIQCGSFTTSASRTASITLGWEPQWVLIKRTDAIDDWYVFDNMRGMPVGSNDQYLNPNTSGAESSFNGIEPTATGFNVLNWAISGTYIYIAIRRGPMRTPTSGTSVFSPDFFGGGTVYYNSGFPTDLALTAYRPGDTYNTSVADRLRGGNNTLVTSSTAAEIADTTNYFDNNVGFGLAYTGGTNSNYIGWLFRRAPSFFDEVCYTGTGSYPFTINHNLGVEPELIIIKRRSSADSWWAYAKPTTSPNANWYQNYLSLNSNIEARSDTVDITTSPTSTTIRYDGYYAASGGTYVNYLFASCPGVSKVGSYTGNGSSQTINCGFAAGARFVMIKRTDGAGDWYVWDSARGIVAGNDPRLSLNSTAAEVTTDDSVDTDSSGFVVNQLSATNINVSSATYIYLAVA